MLLMAFSSTLIDRILNQIFGKTQMTFPVAGTYAFKLDLLISGAVPTYPSYAGWQMVPSNISVASGVAQNNAAHNFPVNDGGSSITVDGWKVTLRNTVTPADIEVWHTGTFVGGSKVIAANEYPYVDIGDVQFSMP